MPFVGKDVPSLGAEFSSPEVVIGMTIAAFRIEGMREARHESPSSSSSRTRSRRSPARPSAGSSGTAPQGVAGDRLGAAQGRCCQLERRRSGEIPEVLPLELLQPSEAAHIRALMTVMARVPTVAMYYLRTVVFPQTQTLTSEGGGYAAEKLSASGADIGGDCVFGVRLGFSGTPSDLIPLSMQVRRMPCAMFCACAVPSRLD